MKMAKKSVKQIISEAKANLKNVSNKTKVKVGAGLMAGSMLFGGLIGCAPTRVNNSQEELETKGVETVEKVEAETNPVLDQTLNEQLANVTERLAQILEAQGVSKEAIGELRNRVNACTTEAQMQSALNSMKTQIEEYVSKEIDEKLSELEQSTEKPEQMPEQEPEQNPENGEIKFGGEIDLDEMLSILQQMSFDVQVGNRTDYHEIFIEAERFDRIIKSTDKEIDETKLDKVQRAISVIQCTTLSLITEKAVDVEQEKTGCVRFDVQNSDHATGKTASGWFAIDVKGKFATVATVEDSASVGVVKDDKLLYLEDGDYVESPMSDEDKRRVFGPEWIAEVVSGSMGSDTDYSYSIGSGYTKTTHIDHTIDGVTEFSTHSTTIKLDENGGVDYVESNVSKITEERNQEGDLISVSQGNSSSEYCELTPISQEEMDMLLKQAESMLAERQNGEEAEQ